MTRGVDSNVYRALPKHLQDALTEWMRSVFPAFDQHWVSAFRLADNGAVIVRALRKDEIADAPLNDAGDDLVWREITIEASEPPPVLVEIRTSA